MAPAVGATLLVDQASKVLSAYAGPGFAGLNLPARNTQFSLGLASAPGTAHVALMAAGLVIAAAALGAAVRVRAVPAWAAGLVLGGSLSNLLDRVVLGSVRDFLHLGPVLLNLADVAVLLGLLTALAAAGTGSTPTTGRR